MSAAEQFAKEVFAAVDAMDGAKFVTYLTPNANFTFGNNPTGVGREVIAAAVNGFFSAINGLNHTITGVFEQDDTIIVRCAIDYTRKDGQVVRLPCANIWTMQEGLINDYCICMDVNPVFA